ncbi:MAG: hypothetical protein RIT81_08600 [Deltaproteobacteria bacterium]
MKLIEELVARATAAEKKAGDLAEQQANVLARQQAYDKLQSLFDGAAADGQLSAEELESLMLGFRDAGLDTSELEKLYDDVKNMDSTQGADVTNELRNAIFDQIHEARIEADTDPFFHFNAQQVMSEHHQAMDLAARVSKAEHDMYMTAVRNLVA